MGKIVVVGSSNTDLVVRAARMPEAGETILGDQFMMTAGGKGANQAVAARRLGGDVTFIAKVGCDMFGDKAIEGYKAEGLDTSTILRDEKAPSGVALITVDSNAENCIVVAPGANNELSTSDIDALRSHIESADYLLLQLEVPMCVVEHAAAIAHAAGVKVVLNPAPAAAIAEHLLAQLELITPNRTEIQLLTGVAVTDLESAEQAAKVLLDKGVQRVVVTLGSMGSLVCDGARFIHVPARKVTAIDTTAAGDTFNAGLCVALCEGRTLEEAVRFATAASAIAVTRLGAQASVPYRHEIEE